MGGETGETPEQQHERDQGHHCGGCRRAEVRKALVGAGWRIDDEQHSRIEASDGKRYGVAVFFEAGRPVCIEYGDGELDLQHADSWGDAPGILAPSEVGRLFHKERGE